MTRDKVVLVSECLLDIPCQYNAQLAKLRFRSGDIDAIKGYIVPVCPEQLSGLATPRKPVEIQGGDGFAVLNHQACVVSADGEDFTEYYIRGAQLVLKIAEVTGATMMITQFRSPSCSCSKIYDGNFSHVLKPGFGVCAALLQLHHIKLMDIYDFWSCCRREK